MNIHFPTPTPAQLNWQRAQTNLFVHFGMNTFTDREWGNGSETPAQFNPARLDCRQWASAARAGGFQIALLTAKHHDGFCLWPSRYTDHSVKSSPWRNGKGDLVREFVDAFRAEGIKVGLYLSPWDRHEPSYGTDRYNDFYCNQLVELLTQYGELHEVWFDGACGEAPDGRKQTYDWQRIFSLVKKHQPGAVTFGDGGTDVRWVGNERGFSGETCWATINPDPIRFPGDSGICEANDAKASTSLETILNQGLPPQSGVPSVWRPAECDVSIRPGWFHHDTENDQVRSVENLVELYFQSAGRNGTLLLNIPPNRDGLFHSVDVERVATWRKTLDSLFSKNFAHSATVTANSSQPAHPAAHLIDSNPDSYWTPFNTHAPHTIEFRWKEPQSIGIVQLKEAITFGQFITGYQVEFETASGEWKTVSTGTTIGHQKLDRIAAATTCAARVTLTTALSQPSLSAVGFYS
jgi:alpha-L-fucosidase